MTSPLPIDRALTDPRLLGAALGDPASWSTWIAVLRACFGLPLDDDQRRVFASVAGDRSPPARRVRELWGLIGRKGGKSKMAGALAVYLALFVKHKLSRGEKGMVLVLAMSVDQARVVFNYCLGFLTESEALRKEIAEVTRSEIRLRNGIVIAVHANSFRSVRGRSLVAAVLDEVCFWRDDFTATPELGSLLGTAAEPAHDRRPARRHLLRISQGWFVLHEAPGLFWRGQRRHVGRAGQLQGVQRHAR